MNIIIHSNNVLFARIVASSVAKSLNLQLIDQLDNITSKTWVMVGAPTNVHEYKNLCAKGLNPDHVFCIAERPSHIPIDNTANNNIEVYYEGIVSTFYGNTAWTAQQIINSIKQ